MNRSNITRLAIAIVVLCFLLSTFVSLWSLRVMAKQNTQALSKTLAANIYDTISAELSEPVLVSRTMARDYFLIEMLTHEQGYDVDEASRLLKDYLSGIREGTGYQSAFLVSSASRRYYAASGASKIIDPDSGGRDSWYADFMADGGEYVLDIDLDEFNHDAWTVFVDARIEDGQGQLLGVCGVGVHMTGPQELFGALEKEYGVEISLVAEDGLIKLDNATERIESARLQDVALRQGDDYDFQVLARNRFAVTKYIDKLGWYLVVVSDGSHETGQFINVILLNVVLCLLVLVILVFAIRIILARTKALTNASFQDQTTQLLNRRAFEEDKAALARLDGDFTCLTADVNGLKAVNDTLGHAAGDELIQGAARCLVDCFGKHGKVYRIGGDEFAAMLRLSPEAMEATVARFEQMTGQWSGTLAKQLSVSCGFAAAREFPSANIAELSRIADERMYAAKEAYYRTSGRDRMRR